MKVKCEYCDSYVDASENETCPNCGAPLSDAVITEETKKRLEKIEEEEKAEKRARELKEEKDRDDVFDLIKTIAGSAAGAAAAGTVTRVAGKALGDFIRKDLKDTFKK